MIFQNQTVLVTGAAGNLGRAVAEAFAENGANLVLVDLKRDHLERAFGAEGHRRIFAPADLLDPSSVAKAIDMAVGRSGRIDVLCNIAGGFRMGEAVHETSDETWDLLFDLNADGRRRQDRQCRRLCRSEGRCRHGCVLCLQERGHSPDGGDGGRIA
jgi:NAD(P)-dependent dehydrogenase (short-subunit alcohol dehydrogenase family)